MIAITPAGLAAFSATVALAGVAFGFGVGYRHADHKCGWWAGLRHGEQKARQDLLRPQRRDPKGRFIR